MYVGHTMSAALDYPLLDHIAMYVVTEYRYDNPLLLMPVGVQMVLFLRRAQNLKKSST